eukprot:12714940-Alexandrium_andersonii.AAC.1
MPDASGRFQGRLVLPSTHRIQWIPTRRLLVEAGPKGSALSTASFSSGSAKTPANSNLCLCPAPPLT